MPNENCGPPTREDYHRPVFAHVTNTGDREGRDYIHHKPTRNPHKQRSCAMLTTVKRQNKSIWFFEKKALILLICLSVVAGVVNWRGEGLFAVISHAKLAPMMIAENIVIPNRSIPIGSSPTVSYSIHLVEWDIERSNSCAAVGGKQLSVFGGWWPCVFFGDFFQIKLGNNGTIAIYSRGFPSVFICDSEIMVRVVVHWLKIKSSYPCPFIELASSFHFIQLLLHNIGLRLHGFQLLAGKAEGLLCIPAGFPHFFPLITYEKGRSDTTNKSNALYNLNHTLEPFPFTELFMFIIGVVIAGWAVLCRWERGWIWWIFGSGIALYVLGFWRLLCWF